MINLLPPVEKARMQKEYKLRVLTLYILFIAAATFIGLVLLLPSYFFADTIKRGAESEVLTLKNSSESTEREEINNQLRITKERLTAITQDELKIPLYEVIDKVALYADREIAIDRVSYTRTTGDGNSNLQLAGLAETRDDLLSFTKALEDDELFEEVVLPVSSLAKDQDIEFSIQIKGIF